MCKCEKCQACKFFTQEIQSHEQYVRYAQHVKEDVLLVERPRWLELGQNTSTENIILGKKNKPKIP